MFFDLNIPVTAHQGHGAALQSRKNKGKQLQVTSTSIVVFTPAQVAAIEARIDLLVHLGYTVIALNQTVEKKIDPKTHVNILDELLSQLKKRTGVVFLKRLTINIDEDSEKGFGLTSASVSVTDGYDLIALVPTTPATFSAACLTHSLPSLLTAHIIALPLTLPRLPFHLKHTLVSTAIRNGAVFEVNYAGAFGDPELSHASLGVSDTGLTAKRNWWAAAREVVRVTKVKGVIVSGGVIGQGDYRSPRDVQNLMTLLGLAQNLAHDAFAVTPKSLVLRAQARKTYRAVLSQPRIVVPITSGEAVRAPSKEPSVAQAPAQSSTAAGLSATDPGTPAPPPPTPSRECHSATEKRRREPDSDTAAAGLLIRKRRTVHQPQKKKKKHGVPRR
ncbi:RNase P subunit p30-domain-containing protein [Boletus edulis BED1]|uniref:RNase P subunit p30-domain-containing protein n=1 Tax=Boletus edulis BED1 TaxID=1328754 RepID=A0AAD4GC74_BOLED|nr:RNase P subunit p30-domain-containing protein [Boletus edulis BED1]